MYVRREKVEFTVDEAISAVAAVGSVDRAASQVGATLHHFRAFCREHNITATTVRKGRAQQTTTNQHGIDHLSISEITKTEETDDESEISERLRAIGEDPGAWVPVKGKQQAKQTTDPAGLTSTIRTTQWELLRRTKLADLVPHQGAYGRPLRFTPRKRALAAKGTPQKVVVLPDIHAGTTHDPVALALTLEKVRRLQPDKIILSGDQLDYSSISTHAPHPQGLRDSVNHCIQVLFKFLGDLRAVAPHAEIVWLDGNHDYRLSKIWEKDPQFRQFMALCRGGESTPLLSHRYLLRFDELGIRETEHTYPYGYEPIAANLRAEHGNKTGPNAVRKTIERTTYGATIGHTHAMSIYFETRYDERNQPIIVPCFNLGTLAQVEATGMHYAHNPSWQQGFGIFYVYPDDQSFSWSIAQIIGDRLFCEGERLVCTETWDDSYDKPEAYC